MIKFFIDNRESFIISTIYLLLGYLPTFIDYMKVKNKNNPIDPININNSTIVDSFNKNTDVHNHITNNIEVRNNSNTNISSSTDEPAYIFILFFIFILAMIIFYKYINKFLLSLTFISALSLFLSILINKTILKINNYVPIPDNIFKISNRNIILGTLLLINCIIVFYKIKYSPSMMPLMDLINTLNMHCDSESFLKVYRFILDNIYESYTGIFIIFNFGMALFIIFKLFISFVFIISVIKVSINPNKRLWIKIYNSLNKNESNLDKTWWIFAFIILFTLSTGLLAYIFSLIIRVP